MEGEEDETEEIWFRTLRREDFDENFLHEIIFTRSDLQRGYRVYLNSTYSCLSCER